MNIYETILSRRTIRKFKQEEINTCILEKLINAARLAPSTANLQPLEYLVINDSSLKEQVFANLVWAGDIKPYGDPGKDEKPAAYIVILVNEKINPASDKDIGASAENINLVAEEEGIGCCWMGAFKKRRISKILGIPQNYSVGLILALGYPTEKPTYEDIDKGSPIKYYKDSSGNLNVPKRKLKDIMHLNSF